jgi:hypothetical protein
VKIVRLGECSRELGRALATIALRESFRMKPKRHSAKIARLDKCSQIRA